MKIKAALKSTFWALFLLSCAQLNGQSNLPEVKISGLVKTDFFFDTRQTVSAREGHFLLFPSAPSYDLANQDINASSSFNLLPIQSNLSIKASEMVVGKSSLSAIIEGDFFGQSNGDVNMLRLRLAYIKIARDKAEILAGQYWHPFFATSCYPGTVSFNTGSPIQPFSRSPQFKLTYKTEKSRYSISLVSQRDYCTNGPEGVSSKYLREAYLPEFVFSAEHSVKTHTEFTLGGNLGYKRIRPQSTTREGYKASEYVSGITANMYLKIDASVLTLKLQGAYLENASDLLALSGFAVKDSIDLERGFVTYVPLRTISCWTDLSTNGKKVATGIFVGYSENLGAGTDVKGPYYLMSNMPVRNIFRVSPRLIIKRGPLSYGFEVEYTHAGYGTGSRNGSITNLTSVDNTRLLMSAMYKF